VYHHEAPPAEEPAETYATGETTSTNVTIAIGDGASTPGTGTIGAVVGAALGGFLGSNIGGGNGRLAATAAGTLAGWVVGGKIADPAR